jgi:ABC-type nitrate/sulfonate/bicarbonate transport system ATPase subunit
MTISSPLALSAEPPAVAVATSARPVLEASRLTISYPGQRGTGVAPLQDFSLAIETGRITCILGASGSGKTTLLRALGGFITGAPTGGVLFDGTYLEGPTPEIVMIFQENNLFPWLNVRDNVGFGLRYCSWGADEKARRLASIIATVGLADAIERYPHQLSGGMRQRAAIARALVTEPRVLLLDEPFSALDVTLRRRMSEMTNMIWSALGTTMVMVTHNVEEAITMGHRVVILGRQPAQVILDEDTSDPQFKDRYGSAFLALQRRIENLIE